jgi:Fe-S cluster biosynthesis and repair protein YggX
MAIDEAALPKQRSGMERTVACVKLGREAEGLDKPPFKGELGQKVFETVSKEAWRGWLEHSKMIINEYRLDLTSEQGQRVWMTELERYFYGEGSELPPEFKSHG